MPSKSIPVTVESITPKDIPAAIETIQQSMNDDPYHDWLYDMPRFNTTRNTASLTIRLNYLMATGGRTLVAHTADRRCAGVAMWMPPKPKVQDLVSKSDGKAWKDAPMSWGEWLREWGLWFQQLGMNMRYGRGGLKPSRYYLWKERQAECQREFWTDPRGYWFLNILGVHPSAQGLGIGRKLVDAITDIADAEGHSCYLESSKEQPNTTIYNRMHFHTVKKLEIQDGPQPEDQCTLFCMIREPQPVAKGTPDTNQ